jgi:preprotein translocase subunit SecE
VVYRGGLENRFRRKPNGGSNPSLSARIGRVGRKCQAAARRVKNEFVNSWIHIAITAAAVGLIFAYLWWQGQVTRFADYIRETREELRKCSWPTWVELRGSTVLIGVVIVILCVFTVVVDLALREVFFNFLYKL